MVVRAPEDAPRAPAPRPSGNWATAVATLARRARRRLRGHETYAAALGVGLVLRLLVLRSTLGRVDADEAMGMLMARQAADGELRAFLWGQEFGGVPMTYLEAGLVRLVGSDPVVFRAVNVVLVLAVVEMVRRVGTRLFDGRVGDLAAALLWLFPALWLVESLREYEYLNPSLLAALTTAWCALRWRDDGRRRWLFLMGWLSGLVFWVNPFAFALAGPAVAGVAWACRRRPGNLLRLAALVPVGAAPWLWRNLHTGFATLDRPPAEQPFTVRLLGSVTDVLPAVFTMGNGVAVEPWVTTLLGVGLLAGAAAALEHGLRRGRPGFAACGAAGLVWPVLVAASGMLVAPSSYRYAFFLLPALCLLAAAVAARLPVRVTLLGLAAAVSLHGLVAYGDGLRPAPRPNPSVAAVADHLVAAGRTAAFGTYWVGYPVTLAADERAVVAPLTNDRYPEHTRLARAAPRSTYVVPAGGHADAAISTWVADVGVPVRRSAFGSLAVHEFDRRVLPEDLPPLPGEPWNVYAR